MKWIQIGEDSWVVQEQVAAIRWDDEDMHPVVVLSGGFWVTADHFWKNASGRDETLLQLRQRLSGEPTNPL